MEFTKIEADGKHTNMSLDFQSFVELDNANRIYLLKFLSEESKNKLVDHNLFNVIFNIAGSPEYAYGRKIKEMKDVIVTDGSDHIYWYHSWNHRSIKYIDNTEWQMRNFCGYNGVISTIDAWENFGKDMNIEDDKNIHMDSDVLELHEFEDGEKQFSWVSKYADINYYQTDFFRRDMRYEQFDKYWKYIKQQIDSEGHDYLSGNFGLNENDDL
jgi:hypothetical protein